MLKKTSEFAYDFIENKSRNRTFQKYALLCALEYFLLSRKNYTAISHIYSGMNLYDNSELLRMLHSDMTGNDIISSLRGTALVEGGTNIKLTFSSMIYEDILKLASIYVVDRHDERLLEMIRYFIEGAMDPERDPDVVFGQYWSLFLSLYDTACPKVNNNFAMQFYRRIFERKKHSAGKTADVRFDMMLEQATLGTEFEKQHYLDRTVDEVLAEAGKFLGAGSALKTYGEIRRFHPARIDGTAGGEFLRRQAGLFDDLLGDHNFSVRVFRTSISEWTDRKIRSILRDMIASYYPGALARRRLEAPGQSGRPALKYFPSVPYMLCELYYLLLADSALSAVASLQEDYYRNFNFDKITDLETIKEMKKSLSQATSELENERRRRQELEKENASLSRVNHALKSGESEGFHKELDKLHDENLKLREELDHLRHELDIRDEYINALESSDMTGQDEEDEGQEKQVDMGLLSSFRFMFLGGSLQLRQSLRHDFPGAVFVESETQQASLSGIDYIVMFVKHMSHALYYKYIDTARSLDIPVIYCNMRNYDMVLRQIYERVKAAWTC